MKPAAGGGGAADSPPDTSASLGLLKEGGEWRRPPSRLATSGAGLVAPSGA